MYFTLILDKEQGFYSVSYLNVSDKDLFEFDFVPEFSTLKDIFLMVIEHAKFVFMNHYQVDH